jgi:hypothetical protein
LLGSELISNPDAVFDFYFALITLMNFPSGIPMHLSANQLQQQLASCGRLNLRCGHEGHSQSSSRAERSRQIAVFRDGLPSLASVRWDLGEVRCVHSNFPRRSLKLRWAMKHFQLTQFDPARLFTYVLSRLVEPHAVERDRSKERISSGEKPAVGRDPGCSLSAWTPEDIRKTTERRWPARYY